MNVDINEPSVVDIFLWCLKHPKDNYFTARDALRYRLFLKEINNKKEKLEVICGL